jgi:hypothetical protein
MADQDQSNKPAINNGKVRMKSTIRQELNYKKILKQYIIIDSIFKVIEIGLIQVKHHRLKSKVSNMEIHKI